MARTTGDAVHPRWHDVDLDDLRRAVADLAGRPVRRIHAWSNVVFDDGELVWRAGPDAATARRAALVHRHCADRGVPTLPPPDPGVVPLTAAGRTWYLVTGPHVELTGIDPDSLDWDELGRLLATVHHVAPPRDLVGSYDPLVWTRSRLEHIADDTVRDALAVEVEDLSRRLTELAVGTPGTLLHGDVHLDNLAVHDGRLVIYDWESASVGPPAGDLWPSAGWIKRTGRPTVAQLDAMWAGYRELAGAFDLGRWPPLLDAVADVSARTWELGWGR
jgi:aminoglycoside phosphotransferase (APT) family kinase protein